LLKSNPIQIINFRWIGLNLTSHYGVRVLKSTDCIGVDCTEMCSGPEADSMLRRIGSCITQLKAHGPSRTCNESKEEEEG